MLEFLRCAERVVVSRVETEMKMIDGLLGGKR